VRDVDTFPIAFISIRILIPMAQGSISLNNSRLNDILPLLLQQVQREVMKTVNSSELLRELFEEYSEWYLVLAEENGVLPRSIS